MDTKIYLIAVNISTYKLPALTFNNIENKVWKFTILSQELGSEAVVQETE